jgi:ABC-type polysaccharide/polyol phosphate transport system ATPase subunit
VTRHASPGAPEGGSAVALPRGVAIRATRLSKTFHFYLKPGDVLRDIFSRAGRAMERQALRDVTFEVHRGEVVGILGRNGAGKSTLLKLIAGTLDRTAGELEVNGRITAILELGTGFHPEYSGRENIRLGGLCLGMSRDEVERKADSIIDFAEMRDVIDQPFRTYSTGMQARLTFATAISVDPDILIIDEALSVGDARFQMKCFARMAEFRKQGRTILLVSHDTNTITTFCDRAIVLEDGEIYMQADARTASASYLRLLFGERPDQPAEPIAETQPGGSVADQGAASPTESSATAAGTPVPVNESDSSSMAPSEPAVAATASGASRRFGDGALEVVSYGLTDSSGAETRLLVSGQRYQFHMRAVCRVPIPRVSCGFAIKDRRGTVVFGVTNVAQSKSIDDVAPGETIDIRTGLTMWLAEGDYFINLGFSHLTGEMCDFLEDGIQFRVSGPGGIFTTAVVNLEAEYTIERAGSGVHVGQFASNNEDQ